MEEFDNLSLAIERGQVVARQPYWVVLGNVDDPDYSIHHLL